MKFYRVADYMAEARVLLLDQVQPYRYDDDGLVTALNSAMYDIAKIRPDILADWRYKRPLSLQNGLEDNIPELFDPTNSGELVPIPAPYKMATVYYMVANLQLRDVEDSTDQRASIFMGLFKSQMTSV